jgi:hypothetical protein
VADDGPVVPRARQRWRHLKNEVGLHLISNVLTGHPNSNLSSFVNVFISIVFLSLGVFEHVGEKWNL